MWSADCVPVAAGALVGHAAPGLAAYSATLRRALGVAWRVPVEGGVALTFDDGPHPSGTPAVLDVLARADAKATFFLLGEHAERWPALVGEIVAAGHEVAVHGYRHRDLLVRGPGAVREDLRRAREVLEQLSGRSVRLWRPPHGVLTTSGLSAARERGWQPMLWSRWGRDWRAAATPVSIAREASTGVVAGDVLLLHDADHHSAPGSWRATALALPTILEAITEAGCVPVRWPGGPRIR